MHFIRPAFKFRMELDADKPWVIIIFYNLNQTAARGKTYKAEAEVTEQCSEIIVKLVPVTVTLGNNVRAVERCGPAARLQLTGIFA